MDMKQIMLDIGCDGQSALDRAFRSACMCKNKGILGSWKHHLRAHNVKEPYSRPSTHLLITHHTSNK